MGSNPELADEKEREKLAQLLFDLAITDSTTPENTRSAVEETVTVIGNLLSATASLSAWDDPGPFQEITEIGNPISDGFDLASGLSADYVASCISAVGEAAFALGRVAASPHDESARKEAYDHLRMLLDSTRDEVIRLRRSARDVRPMEARAGVDDALRGLQHDLDRAMRGIFELALAESAADRAEREADRARSSAKAASESAGITAEGSLSEHFDRFATKMNNRATFWRAFSFGVAALAVGLALVHLASVPELSMETTLRRLAVAVPIGAVFAISAFEASNRRAHAQWAEHIAVQLRSIRAFTDELPDGGASIREHFAQSVLMGAPELSPRRRGAGADSALTNPQVKDLVELARALSGPS